jgi:hypothetical protein
MKKAGDLLGAFFDERVLRAARGYSELFTAWQSLVGEKLAAHSKIAELNKSILLVEADHPGWIQILQTKQASILDGVQKRFPDLSISGISFRLAKAGVLGSSQETVADGATDSEPQTEKEAPSTVPYTPAAALDEDPYSRIEDTSFKDLLQRLEKSIKARNKTR